MEDVSKLTALARALGQDAFAERFAGQLFLVKPPGARLHRDAPEEDPPLSYQTTQAHVDSRDLDAHDVFGSQLRVWAIQKKHGNPYQDRISVGRARNCDLVLRAPYLSKLHAHFWREENGSFLLSDNRSANGTRLNAQLILPGEGMPVHSGDRVQFGGLELIVVDANKLFTFLLV